MSDFNKRPSAKESDEDVMRQFEEMQRSRNFVPSANVTKMYSTNVDQAQGQSSGKRVEPDEEIEKAKVMGEELTIEEVEEPIISSIKEKYDPNHLESVSSYSLPSIGNRLKESFKLKLDFKSSAGPGESGSGVKNQDHVKKKKKSLFAQALDKKDILKSNFKTESIAVEAHGNQEDIVGDTIHPGLSGMTEKEILEEQRKLLERLDPKLIEFIKSRKDKCNQKEPASTTPSESVPIPVPVQDSSKAKFNYKELPIDIDQIKSYPGMDTVEPDKMQWMGTIKSSESEENNSNIPSKENKNESSTEEKTNEKFFNARFDFEGFLLPEIVPDDSKTFDQGLHHHGEEMERPGYTIHELLTLARSTKMQQRCTAYEALGKIYKNAHTGILAGVTDKSIFELYLQMDFIWIVRKGLDHTDSVSINSSLNCLSSILFLDHEELYLDKIHLLPESKPFPLIIPSTSALLTCTEKRMKDMKDQEILELDLIHFLVHRSNLIERLEYLICAKKVLLRETGVESLLKILVRISRHSPNLLIKHYELLKGIFQSYILMGSSDSSDKKIEFPQPSALKLFRILIDSNLSNAREIYNKFNILPVMLSFLAYDQLQWNDQTSLLKSGFLVLESFKMWIGFLSYGLATNEYQTFYPKIIQFLHFYNRNDGLTPFDLYHCSHLISLLFQLLIMKNETSKSTSTHAHWPILQDSISLVSDFMIKLIHLLISDNLKESYDHDQSYMALTCGLNLLEKSLKYQPTWNIDQVFEKFLNSSTCTNLLNQLKSHSLILCKATKMNLYPENFESTGVVELGILNPILQEKCPYSLLSSLIRFGNTCGKRVDFNSNQSMKNYLECIMKTDSQSQKDKQLESNYFLKLEFAFLFEMVKNIERLDDKLQLILKIKNLVQISDHDFGLEFLSYYIQLTTENVEDFKKILSIYEKVISNYTGLEQVEKKQTESKVRFDVVDEFEDQEIKFQRWNGKLFPEYLFLEPLYQLKRIWTSTPEESRNFQTRNEMSLILKYLKQMANGLIKSWRDFVTFYCRIVLCFMFDEHGFFMDSEISTHLHDLLKIILTYPKLRSKEPIFSHFKEVDHFTPLFSDFYTELCNSYISSSFGSEIFTAYMLLPLRVCEDAQIKMTFWTTCSTVFLRNTFDNDSFLSQDYLTFEPELDETILKTFLHAVQSCSHAIRNSFALQILKFHLSQPSAPREVREKFVSLKFL